MADLHSEEADRKALERAENEGLAEPSKQENFFDARLQLKIMLQAKLSETRTIGYGDPKPQRSEN